jgi:hypothetical protein
LWPAAPPPAAPPAATTATITTPPLTASHPTPPPHTPPRRAAAPQDNGTRVTAYPTSFMRAAGKMTMKKWKLAIRTAAFHRQLKANSALMTIGEFLHAAGQHAVAK